MMEKVRATGFLFDETYSINIHPESTGKLRNPALGIYRIMKKIVRAINTGTAIRTDEETRKQTNENVIRKENIHHTCLERMHKNPKYQARNISDAIALSTPFEPIKEHLILLKLRETVDVSDKSKEKKHQ